MDTDTPPTVADMRGQVLDLYLSLYDDTGRVCVEPALAQQLRAEIGRLTAEIRRAEQGGCHQ